jgi:elongation factor P--(R)-beta-lysine ligase
VGVLFLQRAKLLAFTAHLPFARTRGAGMSRSTPWWHPDTHEDRRPRLMARNRITAALRAWFAADGFVEIEAAALQVSPGNETHLHAFGTEEIRLDGSRRPLHLHTSPEFAAKKLLAAGEDKIVALARVFRNRERSALHHPEFTMLEWYRSATDYTAMMADCAGVLAAAAEAAGVDRFTYRGAEIDPREAPERLTLAEAFDRFAAIDLLASVAPDGQTDRDAFAAAVARAGIRVAADDRWSDLFSRVLLERVEPAIGRGRATILMDYPVPEAALARVSPHDPRVAERFELYACGVELANAFSELTDQAEQRRRFEADMDEKARLYGERYPIDEDFLDALALMPPSSGCALGFDRLVMLATGAARIEDVIWTPVA